MNGIQKDLIHRLSEQRLVVLATLTASLNDEDTNRAAELRDVGAGEMQRKLTA